MMHNPCTKCIFSGRTAVFSQCLQQDPHKTDGSPLPITAMCTTEQLGRFRRLLCSVLSLFQYFNSAQKYLVFLGLLLQERVL